MITFDNKYYGFVYETVNTINGKKYIGKCIFKRKNNWETYLGSGVYLKKAIKKYGKENFKRDILFLACDKEELEEIEEFLIKFHDAANSKIYYNLKETSIGGDTLTNHPNREKRIRKMSESVKGSNNPMYQKKKSEKMIESVKQSNSKKICVDGIIYNSSKEYSDLSGIATTVINYRLRSNGFPSYKYLDEVEFIARKPIIRKSVLVDGVKYKSIYDASKQLGISRATLRNRIKDINYPSYQETNN